jgi:hypothetical protein
MQRDDGVSGDERVALRVVEGAMPERVAEREHDARPAGHVERRVDVATAPSSSTRYQFV